MATINGKSVPTSSYPVSTTNPTYWTTDGKSTGTTKSYKHSTLGTAESCMGFSYYIYNYIWGADTYGKSIAAKDTVGTSADFSGIAVGSRINCTVRSSNTNHSMVVTAKDTNGVTVYDCNWDKYPSETCRVGQRTLTWKEFGDPNYKDAKGNVISKFKKITGGQTPS